MSTRKRFDMTVWLVVALVLLLGASSPHLLKIVDPLLAVSRDAEADASYTPRQGDRDPWGRSWRIDVAAFDADVALSKGGRFVGLSRYSAGPNGVDETGGGDDVRPVRIGFLKKRNLAWYFLGELLPRLAILLGWIWFGARGLRRRDGRRELATQACLSIPTVLLAWSLVDSASLLPADLTPWGSLAAVAPKVMIPATLVLVGLCGVAALRHHEVGMIGDADGARPPARYGRFLLGSLIGWALLWSGAGTLSDSRFRALEQTPSGWQRVEFPAGGVLVESQTGRWAALWPSPDGRPVGLVGVGVTLEGFSNGSAVVDLGRLVQVQLSPRPGLVYRVERYKGVTGEWALAEEWKAELERLKSGDIPECYEDFLVRRRR